MLEETNQTAELIQRVAALDIGKAELVSVCGCPARQAGQAAAGGHYHPTMTRSLLALADRLAGLGVTRVVLEATSDSWKPVF